MAFDPTNTADRWHYLLEIDLTGGSYVRYAESDITLDDGTFYEGRLTSITSLSLSTGGLLDPRIVSPSLEMSIRNTDDVPRASAEDNSWGNKDTTLKLGQGIAAADFDTVFDGVVRAPGGVSYWDDLELRLLLDDVRSKDSKVLPPTKIDPAVAAYTNAEAKSYYKVIPIIYGDWQGSAPGALKVPAYQINSTAGTGGKFSIADHALKEIEQIFNNTTDITANCTLDAANGQFTITSGTYTPATDVITCHVQGSTDDGLTTGTLLQELGDIFDDILQTWLSVASGDIDSTAITAWNAELVTADYGRRWIGTEISSDDLIRDLLIDGFADITIEDGKYKPVYRAVSPSAGIPDWFDFTIREKGDGSKMFSVRLDPQRLYANEVVADFRFDPIESSYAVNYTKQNTAAITAFGSTKRRRLTLNWIYVAAGAETRTNREVFVFSTEPEHINLTVDPEGMTKVPTDQFNLTYSKYDSTPCMIRDISINFVSMQAQIEAWNMLLLTPGRWTSSSAPAWSAATATQKAEQGFWCDANGEADPGDTTSAVSIWF